MYFFTYELPKSCKHLIRFISLSSVHLKRACEVAITRTKYQIFIQIGKKINYMENLKFSSRVS